MAGKPNIDALFFLGRRVERLFLGGILLVVLCFVEAYLTTANKQFLEDHSVSTIAGLLKRLESEESRLADLFQAKSELNTSPVPNNAKTRQKEITVDQTRKLLGLPPRPFPNSPEVSPKITTYKEALEQIVNELGEKHLAHRLDFARYVDSTKQPNELILSLRQQLKTLEDAPTTVWGIQTPRILQVQYAGLDYKFPFGFLSSAVAIALAPLIVGWLGALYMTRQRELVMIANLEDYKLAFPHVLNALPVNFKIHRELQLIKSRKDEIKNSKINRTIHKICRTFVILLFTLPLLLGFIYSLVQLWEEESSLVSSLFYVAGLMVFVMTLQAIYLVLQEWIVLSKKQFYE
ncbi:MAG: hypothetical protein J0H48_12525 [Nitrosospira multiformis]|nr:hypothetical protein [Nitrosospira multiformis]